MTTAATLSIASGAICLVAAVLAFILSSAPGWRQLRWFAACATFAALFNLTSALSAASQDFDPSLVVSATRLNLFSAGLFAVMWFKYVAASEKRRLSRLETGWTNLSLALSLLILVPGLAVEERAEARALPLFDTAWTKAPPTGLGLVLIVFSAVTFFALFARTLVQCRRGDSRALTHTIAIGGVAFGAAHDGLVMAGVFRSFYVLDFALLISVLGVSGAIASTFVSSARALEVSARELAAAQHELVAKERLAVLGELSATLAHEVRNPLAVVFNATAGLRREGLEPTDREALVGIIQEEAERLRDLVSDLLEFSRPRPAIFDETSLFDIVHGAVDAATKVVGVPRTQVVLELDPQNNSATCDGRLMRQAIVNLVTNALHATGRRGPVKVAVVTPADAPHMVAVRVTDDGAGIAEELQEQIFKPFFSTRPMGTGLGLAIVRRCADAHHGTVKVESALGQGATFELRFRRSG